MNKIWLFVITLLVNTIAFSQQKDEARTIVFKENKIIYHQKKLKPISFVVTNLLGYGATILTVFGLIAAMLGHI